ncbi:transposase [Streptomyces tendae]|uniref:transposase n=1 Tax=Streptomyces tendae TaxID=1932 RepID=UPI00371F7E79
MVVGPLHCLVRLPGKEADADLASLRDPGGPEPRRPARSQHRDGRTASDHRRRHPDRLRSEAFFAHLCAAAPIPASSGRTNRHRNRGGDRHTNSALCTIVLVRRPPERGAQIITSRCAGHAREARPEICRTGGRRGRSRGTRPAPHPD